ncbi:MAG: hypothetical protein GVY28_04955 [Alphaproteobacteria bacterium]|nr:hypothetical protein [Alphaproteobacteria bacterium]
MMSSFQSSGYQIERPSGQCAATGRTLEPGQAFIAVLVEDEHGGLCRLDYSPEAWEGGERPSQCFGFWKTTVPQPQARRKPFVDDQVLMNLLGRLEEADEPQRLAFRFVLMLILMRKKLLRYDRTERQPLDDGGEREWWVLTPKADLSKGPLGRWSDRQTIRVLDPQLDEAGIEQVTEQLGEILNAEL